MTAKHHYNKNLGFTLIELIVVVAIMAVLGVIFTDILIQAIRGQNKVKAINMVKQNGQVVMDKLSNEIREAESLVCIGKKDMPVADVDCQTTACDTIVIYKNGLYSRYRLVSPTSSVNGVITRNDFSKDLIPDNTENTLCGGADISNTPLTNLSDINTISGVSLDYYKDNNNPKSVFSKTSSSEAGFGETIVIQFIATAGVEAGSNYDVTVKEGGIPFKTAVGIRGGQR